MGDQELIREFIRLEHVDGALRFLVGSIDWDGPAHPTLSWSVARKLPGVRAATPWGCILAAMDALLSEPRGNQTPEGMLTVGLWISRVFPSPNVSGREPSFRGLKLTAWAGEYRR